jgi:hypothetical protein
MNNTQEHSLVIPAFQKSNELSLSLNKTREGESRLLEAKMVNPITYTDLESCFNEGYRELRRHLATIGYELTRAETAVEVAKSNFIIDTYPGIVSNLPRAIQSQASTLQAHLVRDQDYLAAMDRVGQLKAFEALLDGKIKVFEKTCSFMKKKMDLILRSGLSGSQLYVTSGNK